MYLSYTPTKSISNEKKFYPPIFFELLAIAVIFIFFSCEKDELDFNDPATETAMSANIDSFRRKVENPYTIPNMQKALDNLIANVQKGKLKSVDNGKTAIPKNRITANMLYLNFTQQTLKEEGLLKQDSTPWHTLIILWAMNMRKHFLRTEHL